MAYDLATVDQQPNEEHPVERSAYGLVVRPLVHTCRVGQEVEHQADDLPSRCQSGIGIGEAGPDTFAFFADLADLCTQLLLRPTLLGAQVEEVALLVVEDFQPPRVLLLHLGADADLIEGRFVQCIRQLRPPYLWYAHFAAVVATDSLLYFLNRNVRVIAPALLPSDANEVVVLAATPTDRPLDYEPSPAASAPNYSLEVVMVRAVAYPRSLVRIKHALHPLKQRF